MLRHLALMQEATRRADNRAEEAERREAGRRKLAERR